MQHTDWLICLVWTSCEFDEKQATKPKFVAQSRLFAASLFNLQQMFLLCDKLIKQGEKREMLTQNLQQNNIARLVEGFCFS